MYVNSVFKLLLECLFVPSRSYINFHSSRMSVFSTKFDNRNLWILIQVIETVVERYNNHDKKHFEHIILIILRCSRTIGDSGFEQ